MRSISVHLEAFLEMMAAERAASLNTLDAYRRDIHDFEAHLMKHHFCVLEVSYEQIRHYLASLQTAHFSSKTIARKLSAIRRFMQFLFEEELRKDNPALQLESPQSSQRLPKVLTEEEMVHLLEAAHKDTSLEGIRMCTLLEILYATGLRVTELVTLPLNVVQHELGTLKEKPSKIRPFFLVKGKGNKERLVPLTPLALEILEKYLPIRKQFGRQESPWLFPSKASETGHLTRQGFGQLLKALALKANMDPERISPHVIRHSFASHLLRHGADLRVIQELLGHATINTTQIYTHLLNDQLQELVFQHHPLAKLRKQSISSS